ncbi:cache domain-containing sensor histidine kinase [Paenibacillus brevis]|uniref:Sensor histidine kinase n=1 Tax=Paenibacillus brevis TaxID=2841508 RepID=A0ABS6FQ85_9BACL|nr:sensor histidine kinase [Paenibacillus brevis]MBU5671642.1 sensor histidine kinase [Paenibacillus brevis]
MGIGVVVNRSIRFKLLLYFVFTVTFSILTLGLWGSALYKESIEEETHSHTIQMMNQVQRNIEIYLDEMDNVIHYLTKEDTVIEFMRGKELQEGSLDELVALVKQRELLYELKRPEIAGILVVNRSNLYASNTMERITRDPLTEEEWYRAAVGNPDQLHLFSHPIGRNIKMKGQPNLSADQVLSIVRAVKDPVTAEIIGVILIDMRLDFIERNVESVSLGKSGFIFIMDEMDGVVYSPVNRLVYRIKGEWLTGESGSLIKPIFGKEYQIFYNSFNGTGWRIVGTIPLSELLKVVTDLQTATVIVAMFTLLVAFIVSWFFTNSIVRPVDKLRSLMRKVEEGELYIRFPGKSKDEIGQLGNSFNKMVQEIENLINMVYLEQREKREAELKALQAQIKPHFLYNTLDTIQWMAQDRDAQDIVEMVIALTNLFRIGLSKGNEIIGLSKELEHVESYLVIQMARYENKLTYEMDVPAEIRGYQVVKIILQPLVENAIYHGIKLKPGTGKILIRGRIKDNSLTLEVLDDGIGMTEEKLRQVREDLQHVRQSERNSGYGLFNVHERILLSYGPSYGISIDSTLGQGTVIVVRLPLVN